MSRILVVDDEAPVREMLKHMLMPLGHDIVTAANGSEALAVCKNEKIDLVISDIVMPVKHGIDLILELKKTSSHVPVIAISGGGGVVGRYDYLEIAKLIGAENILSKPFSVEEITALVVKSLGAGG